MDSYVVKLFDRDGAEHLLTYERIWDDWAAAAGPKRMRPVRAAFIGAIKKRFLQGGRAYTGGNPEPQQRKRAVGG